MGNTTLIRQSQQAALFQQQADLVGKASAAFQLERNRDLMPTGVTFQIYFTDVDGNPADPGAFEILIQTSDIDLDEQYCLAEAVTGNLNANYVGHVVLGPVYSVFIRIFIASLANPVYTTIYMTAYASAGVGGGGGGGTGGGPALAVNGTPAADQTLLNLTAGTGVTITDEGAGAIQISSSGGGTQPTFDSTPSGLAQPVGNAVFTFPSTTPTSGTNDRLQITGLHNNGDGTQLPMVYIKEAGAADPTNWNTNGTALGINVNGNYYTTFFKIVTSNTRFLELDQYGNLWVAGYIASPSQLICQTPGNGGISLQSTQGQMNGGYLLCWSQSPNSSASTDAILSRKAPGVLQIAVAPGNGTTAPGNNGSLDCLLVNTGQIQQPARLTAQTTAIPATPIQTQSAGVLPAGLYRVNYCLNITTADAADPGTIDLSITWTDDTTAQTFTTPTVPVASLGAYQSGSHVLYSAGAVNVSFSTTLAGVTGAPAYALTIQAERLV